MNFSFYIFGTPKGRYNQYPNDYIASTLMHLQENTVGARLVIQREMNLMHYVYTERVEDSNVIGFCLIFNGVHILKPKQLIKLFRYITEKRLVESGKIIKYDAKGNLHYTINSFNECAKENERLKKFVDDELENYGSKYCIEPLLSIYNGTNTMDTIDFSATDLQILQLTNKHNTVIINHEVGIENGYIEQIMSSIRNQNAEANKKIINLESQILKLSRQKKQYRYVIILTIVIVCCGAGLYFVNNNLKTTQKELSDANGVIQTNTRTISELHRDIRNLNDTLNEEKKIRMELENDYDSLKTSLRNIQPFVIKNTSFDFNTGWLSFEYYGFVDETLNLQVKALGSDYSYSNSASIDIEKGYHSTSIYLNSSLNSSNWYSFELLIGNKIIGGDRH